MKYLKKFKALLGKEITSIDIGSCNIKIIQGITSNNEIIISKAYTISTPTSSYKDGQIYDVEKIAEVIKEEMEHRNFKLNRSTVCSVESASTIYREVLIPYAKESEMIEAVEFEMEQYLPIDIDKYVIQYKLVESYDSQDGKKARVLVVALPIEISKTYFELLSLLKCKPTALDIHSNSINKLLNFSEIKEVKNSTIAAVDLGYEHINIIILQNGVFKFSRLLNNGSKNIDMNIANALNLYLKEAEGKKYELDSLVDIVAESTEEYYLQDNTRMAVNNWIEAIQRIFRYYISRASTNKIDGIYLYGGGSKLPGIAEIFSDFFELETVVLNHIPNVTIKNSGDYKEDDFVYYINALGAMVGK